MNACIFAGPTLPPHDEARALEAVWLPPAGHGDVYRAVSLLRPRAIGIIDGYFQWMPSVWHKEILWAVHEGVHVFGAASMGALRAAELAPFGMCGVGRIFEAYRNGVLAQCGAEPFEDDDEVAVVHGPADSGYLAASEAMVNIRCTLAAAERAGVIPAATRARLTAIAKGLFFHDRSYELVLERARAEGIPATELAALEVWLPSGRVNQKRADALAMLEAMRGFLARDPPPAKPSFAFQRTSFWALAFTERSVTVHDAQETRVLDELRVDAGRWRVLRLEALRALVGSDEFQIESGGMVARRIAEHRGEPGEIERLLEEASRMEALRRMREEMPASVVERQMLAQIKRSGEFDRLLARAKDKLARIASRRDLPEIEEFPDLKLIELRDWYFSDVLGDDMPYDLEQWLRDAGYADPTHFHKNIFSEYVYRKMADAGAAERGGTAA